MTAQIKDALSRVSVVLPSLDPDEKLTAVIDGLLDAGFTSIILVNDGSKSENLHYFEDAQRLHPKEITLLTHEVNRGKGAALKTAFTWFLENRPDFSGVITVDGDNQHHPEDTLACAEKMLETQSIILGVRNFSEPWVPRRSRQGNRLTCAVFKLFCGMRLSDTQTGLRAIPKKYLPILTKISGDRFEYETNMLLAMKRYAMDYSEVSIRTVYIEENKSSHFRVVRDSVRIYGLIFGYFLKYTAASLVCAAVDTGLYSLFNYLLLIGPWAAHATAIATFGARVVSSLLNFYLTLRVVFSQKGHGVRSFVRYYIVVAVQMVLQILMTDGVYQLAHISTDMYFLRTVLYVVVMMVLFFVSYFVQKRWVFILGSEDDEKDK